MTDRCSFSRLPTAFGASQGNLGAGIGWIEASIARAEEDGLRNADWLRLMLCEIYLQMVSGTGRPPLRVVARNLATIFRAALSVELRVTNFWSDKPVRVRSSLPTASSMPNAP